MVDTTFAAELAAASLAGAVVDGMARGLAANATPGLFNFKPSNTFRTRVAIEKMLRGVADMPVYMPGNSKTVGRFSNGSGSSGYTNARTSGWPPQLAAMLTALGIPAQNTSIFTANNLSLANQTVADPRVSFVGAVVPNSNGGGGGFTIPPGCSVSFTPGASFDTVEIYPIVNSGDPFTFSINGSLVETITPTFNGIMQKFVRTVTAVNGTVTIGNAGTNSVTLMGIATRTNAAKTMLFFNAGNDGSKIPAATSSSSNYNTYLQVLAPKLTIINDTITNDARTAAPPTDEATYKTNLRALVTKGQATGDVILMPSPPLDTGFVTAANYSAFVQYNRDIALELDCPMIDMEKLWPAFAVTNAQGLWGDGLHELAIGYGMEARIIASALQHVVYGA